MTLWKSVENCFASGQGSGRGRAPMRIVLCGDSRASLRPLRACSACAGDYEDPDRTAETEEDETHAEEPARTRPQEGPQGWVENEAGDEGVNEKDVDNDEFPAKEA